MRFVGEAHAELYNMLMSRTAMVEHLDSFFRIETARARDDDSGEACQDAVLITAGEGFPRLLCRAQPRWTDGGSFDTRRTCASAPKNATIVALNQ